MVIDITSEMIDYVIYISDATLQLEVTQLIISLCYNHKLNKKNEGTKDQVLRPI